MADDLVRMVTAKSVWTGSRETAVGYALQELNSQREKIFRVYGGVYNPINRVYEITATPKVSIKVPAATSVKTGEKSEEGKDNVAEITELKTEFPAPTSEDYESALEASLKEGKIEVEDTVTLTVVDIFEIKYELVHASANARGNKSLVSAIAREEKTLRERYGQRMVQNPTGVEYKVENYSKGWTAKGKKSKKPWGNFVSSGASNNSIEEAEEKAKAAAGDKKFKGSVYEGVHTFIVYEEPVRPFKEAIKEVIPQRMATVGMAKAGAGSAHTPTSRSISDLV